ncbi:MAG: hypothetical protein J5365_07820 [Erysipelotrichaceae bacterium]|nr:hypothetical protein [Erysipelotrichaceae bacterium]
MNKEKTLILIEEDPTSLLSDEYRQKAYHYALFFRPVNRPLRALRRIWVRYRLPMLRIWFNDWYDHLDAYDTLIVNMNYLTRNVLDIVSIRNPKLRIIGWYWNTVDEKNAPVEYSGGRIEYWSFDENDCRKYGFKRNIQYYSCPEDQTELEKDIDVYFIGREKDRKAEIASFAQICDRCGLKSEFHVISEGDRLLPYREVRNALGRSRAVLEINKGDQVGFTLRVLESLFYGIKLITSNRLIKDTEVYNRNNVFIIGEDDEKRLAEFVRSPYDHASDHLMDDFSLDKWFNNFDEKRGSENE